MKRLEALTAIDGSILMNLGGLTALARNRPRNLFHVVTLSLLENRFQFARSLRS